jgi:predicted nucleic acid-binding protein
VKFLLDTNVVSEGTKPRPNSGVMAWLAAADESHVFLSVITLAELRNGVERLPAGARRARLDAWLTQQLPTRFETRLLPVDAETADICGYITARARARGRTVEAMDALIAATAVQHDLTVVTRNVSDFEPLGARVINPWTGL